MFDAVAITFGALALLTLWREYWRAGGGTLLSLLTVGNVLYGGLTPMIAYYWPERTSIFNAYVNDAGMEVDEAGLFKVMVMVTLFQLASLFVALGKSKEAKSIKLEEGSSRNAAAASIFVGWFMILVGIAGAVWLGLTYNGSPWGLYQISYAERSPLFREHSSQAFLLLLGLYGASQLVVSYLMTGRAKVAALVLLLVTLHGIGIKSKFPIFWVCFIFLITAIVEGVKLRKMLLPMGIALLVLMTMSVWRGAERLSDLPDYIATYQEEVNGNAIRFWENDIPGPASITYFTINYSPVEYSIDPLLEIPKLLIPKFVYDRGAVVSDVWAAKMMGSSYEPGLGFGWSLLCDGYLLAGWLGVIVVGYGVSRLARYLTDLKFAGRQPFISAVMGYTAAPLFFYGVRESAAGLVKALLVMAVVLWVPTILLMTLKKLKILHEEAA
jgi:preprotein translocase subunit SecG